MKVMILGATRGLGRAVARLMAERGDALHLLGRDPEQLERSAADLVARGAKSATFGICDLSAPAEFAAALSHGRERLGGLDTVVVTAAVFATQEQLENDADRTAELLTLNYTNTVLFCEHARALLVADGGGTLCAFSSVAGDRPRSRMLLYGSAKAGLTAYLNGLDHRYRLQGLRTVCVKPGFVHTDMTVDLPTPPFASQPEPVARRVLRAIDRGWPEVYAPPIWRLVMTVIRWLPRWVMRRAKF
jgi:decaprenylphospho-beta-D-erythro-pentofuranosid-2-ulose 2-reductase